MNEDKQKLDDVLRMIREAVVDARPNAQLDRMANVHALSKVLDAVRPGTGEKFKTMAAALSVAAYSDRERGTMDTAIVSLGDNVMCVEALMVLCVLDCATGFSGQVYQPIVESVLRHVDTRVQALINAMLEVYDTKGRLVQDHDIPTRTQRTNDHIYPFVDTVLSGQIP